jgi:hypothetical protein
MIPPSRGQATGRRGSDSNISGSITGIPSNNGRELLRNGSGLKMNSQQFGKKLLVLDLNGTLLDRSKVPYENLKYEIQLNGRYVYLRPGARSFLKNYALRHFDVAIWSSATASNTHSLVEILFKNDIVLRKSLIFVWDRERCTPDRRPEQSVNHATFKDLEKIWLSFPLRYGRENTIAIDDTESKYLNHIDNAIIVPEFSGRYSFLENATKRDSFNCGGLVLSKLINYLEGIRRVEDVRQAIRSNSFMVHMEDIAESGISNLRAAA